MASIKPEFLVTVLSRTSQTVKLLDRGGERVAAADVIRMILVGRTFEGGGSTNRVRWVREIVRPAPKWSPAYRNIGAPAIGPWAGGSPEWYDSYRTQV